MWSYRNQKFSGDPERKNSLTKLVVKKVFFIVISLVLPLTIFRESILYSYGQWLSPSEDNIEGAEVAVVVDSYVVRIEAAAKLLQENKVKALYISFISKKGLDSIIEKYNLPKDKVFWGGCRRVLTTFDQAKSFEKIAVGEGRIPYRKLVLITTNIHLRRSIWTYDHALRNTPSKFTIKGHAISDPLYKNLQRWWDDEIFFNFVRSETEKNIYYWIYYGLLGNTEGYDVPFHDVFDIKGTSYNASKYIEHCNGDW